MRRATFAVVILASAACGLDVVGLDAAGAPAGDGAPASKADGATPETPGIDGGVGREAGLDAGPEEPPPTSSIALSHAMLPTSASVDLTAAGSVDWVNWGAPKTRKSTSSPAISNLTTASSSDCTVYDFPCSLVWSDGTSPAVFAEHAGRCIFASNAFYAFDVLASTKVRTLTLLLGAYQAKGKLTVTLSDGTPAQTDDSLDNKTESMASIQYTVVFSAAAAGASLHVEWRDDSKRPNGSVYLGSAALRE